MSLTDRQKLLVDCYFECGFNKREAIRRAGYKGNPNSIQSRLFSIPGVELEIKRRMDRIEKKHNLTVDWLIDRLMDQAEAGKALAKFLKVDEHGAPYYDLTNATEEELAKIANFSEIAQISGSVTGGKTKKFKVVPLNPMEALDRIAKVMGWYIDKKEISGPDGKPLVETVDLKELARRFAFISDLSERETE